MLGLDIEDIAKSAVEENGLDMLLSNLEKLPVSIEPDPAKKSKWSVRINDCKNISFGLG